jgi:pimeloyl-ACP methyl ester carboxylesterase
VRAQLGARGVEAAAPDLPLTSFADDVATARAAIESAGVGVVVCGHSYGGCVITAAVSGLDSVRRLVYLCAFMVDAGEDPFAMVLADGTSPMLAAMQINEAADTVTLDPTMRHHVFYGDSELAVAEACAERLRPMPFSDSWVSTAVPAWRTVPSTYVTCSHDNALPAALQASMASRATDVVNWDSDHSPWLTRPDDIALLLANYVA